MCQGITAMLVARFDGGPNAGHEVRFGVNVAESGVNQTLIDIVVDEVVVIGLMEYASEIVQSDVELR